MPTPAGVLAIWHDIDEAHEGPVLDWYNREHHLERLGVPGFQRARRYVAIDGEPKFFIYYDVTNPEVLGSTAYLDRVNNPTPWTQASMPRFKNNARTVCSVVERVGIADGAAALTIRFSPEVGRDLALQQSLIGEILPAVRDRELVVSTDLWMSADGITRIHSQERNIRVVPDHVDDWVIVVGATDNATLAEIHAEILTVSALLASGAAPQIDVGSYRLQFSAS